MYTLLMLAAIAPSFLGLPRPIAQRLSAAASVMLFGCDAACSWRPPFPLPLRASSTRVVGRDDCCSIALLPASGRGLSDAPPSCRLHVINEMMLESLARLNLGCGVTSISISLNATFSRLLIDCRNPFRKAGRCRLQPAIFHLFCFASTAISCNFVQFRVTSCNLGRKWGSRP